MNSMPSRLLIDGRTKSRRERPQLEIRQAKSERFGEKKHKSRNRLKRMIDSFSLATARFRLHQEGKESAAVYYILNDITCTILHAYLSCTVLLPSLSHTFISYLVLSTTSAMFPMGTPA